MLPEPTAKKRFRPRKAAEPSLARPDIEGRSPDEVLADVTLTILDGNKANFDVVGRYVRRSFQTTYWMNVALFAIGVGGVRGRSDKRPYCRHGRSGGAISGVRWVVREIGRAHV